MEICSIDLPTSSYPRSFSRVGPIFSPEQRNLTSLEYRPNDNHLITPGNKVRSQDLHQNDILANFQTFCVYTQAVLRATFLAREEEEFIFSSYTCGTSCHFLESISC